MSAVANIRFGFNNRVPYATLACDPNPITPSDYIKDEWGARRAVWPKTNSDGNIVITGTLANPQSSEFIALPGVQDIGDIELKLELFLSPDVNLDLLSMSYEPVRRSVYVSQKALGDWAAGVDPFGGSIPGAPGSIPDTFIHWFGQSVYYDSFRVTIRRASESDAKLENVEMRMLYIGDMMELQSNFTYPHSIKFVNTPRLVQTSGGSWVPTRKQVKSRKMELTFSGQGGEDYNALQQLEGALLGDPFIVSAFPDDESSWMFNNYNMLGRFYTELSFVEQHRNRHGTSLSIVEV